MNIQRMADALWMRIREVEWNLYSANNQANMPTLLKNLASRKQQRALKASYQVWQALCGGDKVHPAAEPSLPFLVDIIGISQPEVQDAILDIFITLCNHDKKQWLHPYQSTISKLTKSSDAILSAKAKDLIQELRIKN